MRKFVSCASAAVLFATIVNLAVAERASAAPAASHERPDVTEVSPGSGSTVHYSNVVIEGRRFTPSSTVTFGGAKAMQVQVLNSHRIIAWAPPKGHGAMNVAVHTSHGASKATHASRYTYVHAALPGTWTTSRATLPSNTGAYDDLRLLDNSCPSATTCYSIGRIQDDYSGDSDPEQADAVTRPVIRTRTGATHSLITAPLPADADSGLRYEDVLDAIDCPASGSCAAIGTYAATDASKTDGYTVKILLLTLSNGMWQAQAAPLPATLAAATDFSLEEPPTLSCGAVGSCVAGVFTYFTDAAVADSQPTGILYRLSGGTWNASTPVVPSGAQQSGVLHVSCATASYCVAALDSYPNTYLDVLSGSTWSAQTVQAPKETKQGTYRPDVVDLQCAAAAQCTALTDVNVDSISTTTFLRLAGSTQTQFVVPLPADQETGSGSSHGYLAATDENGATIACPSVAVCFATDVYVAKRGSTTAMQSVVAQLDGTAVHVYVMPEPVVSGSTRTVLRNLACPSVSSCVAVGRRAITDPAAAYDTFADGVWTPGSLPTVTGQPSPSQGQLVDLSCAAVGSCFADADYAWDNEFQEALGYSAYVRSTDLDAVLSPN